MRIVLIIVIIIIMVMFIFFIIFVIIIKYNRKLLVSVSYIIILIRWFLDKFMDIIFKICFMCMFDFILKFINRI